MPTQSLMSFLQMELRHLKLAQTTGRTLIIMRFSFKDVSALLADEPVEKVTKRRLTTRGCVLKAVVC